MGAVVLLVGDSGDTGLLLAKTFCDEGIDIHEAHDGRQGVILAAQTGPSIVVTEVDLPDMSAIDLILAIREWSAVPIIALSNDSSVERKAQYLNSGADDYLVKPVGIAEFGARLRVALRHRSSQGPELGPLLKLGSTTIDLAARSVHKDGKHLPMPLMEFQVLIELAKRPGLVVTHQAIQKKVWGRISASNQKTLRVYIGSLRKRLGNGLDGDIVIEAISGVGYRLHHAYTDESLLPDSLT